MSLLKNPNEITKPATFCGLIYGQPGIGKTTLALSAPKPVLIDADRGIHRVEPRFRVQSLPLVQYEDVIALFEGNELAPFETVVFDTFGKLLDRMAEKVIRDNPKNGKGGGSLSLQGYGALKVEFQNLMRLAQGKGKNLLFVAHEKEEKDGDSKIVRPDATGSSGKDIVKELDFMGYMESRDNKRTISFSPSDKFYAKNSLKLPMVIQVPDTVGGNDFIQKNIVARSIERMADENAENKKYEDIIAVNTEIVASVKDAKTANAALEKIEAGTVLWDSKMVAKRALSEKVTSLGLEYNKEKKQFVKSEKKEEQKAENSPESTETPAQNSEVKKEESENDKTSDNSIAA